MHRVVAEDVARIIADERELLGGLAGRTVLVTGSTGTIGRYIVYTLAELFRQEGFEGSRVIAHARNREKAAAVFGDYLGDAGFSLLVSDIAGLTDVEGGLDYAIHTASPTMPGDFKEHAVEIIKANAAASDNLLAMCVGKGGRFCLLSTLEVYGEVVSDTLPAWVTEDDYGALDSLSLRSAYPESKRLAENLCVAYRAEYGADAVVCRVTPTISPVVELSDKRVFADFFNRADAGEDIVLLSDGSAKRTYTYITDIVTGILYAVLKSEKDGDFVFNVAQTGRVLSIREMAEEIIRVFGRPEDSLKVRPTGDSSAWSRSTGQIVTDASRLESLGWKPRMGFTDCVERALAYRRGGE
jgi:dTDP-glucose 4,6-dehydratase